MPKLTVSEIGRRLTKAGRLKARAVCIHGADVPPKDAIRTTAVSSCVARAILTLSVVRATPPIYIGKDTLGGCCGGGVSHFGFGEFNPGIKYFVSYGSKDFRNGAAEYLRATPELVEESWRVLGKITPLGRYIVIRACEDLAGEDPGVRSVLCFAGAEQIRNLCGLVHFRSRDQFNEIVVPQGASCASFVTFAAGMAEGAPKNAVFLGPCDPTGNSWFPPDMMSMAIPIKIARRMCEDLEDSFILKRPQVAYPARRTKLKAPKKN
jgi:hypothetical protein